MSIKEPEQFRETAYFSQFWQALHQDKPALISLYLFLGLLFLVFFGHLLAPYQSDRQFIGSELLPPVWDDEGVIGHFFGTDDLGRDIFSRILYGFYYTTGSALIITVVIALLGGAIGIWTGLSQSKSGSWLSHLFDTFLFIPSLLMAIIITTLMESSLLHAIFATFLVLLPHFIHKIHELTQRELKREYVITLRLDGATRWDLVKEVVFPNLSSIAVRELSHLFVIAVLDISALSFISLGAKSPTPEWGTMIKDSIELIYVAPWTVIIPGLAVVFVIFVVTMLGTGIARVLEK